MEEVPSNLPWQQESPQSTIRRQEAASRAGSYTLHIFNMGCKNSKVKVLQVKPSDERKSGWGAQSKGKPGTEGQNKSHEVTTGRDGSATSKGTMDSGLGKEDESAGGILPGAVTEKASSPRRPGLLNNDKDPLLSTCRSQEERQASSDILEELITQGIIQTKTKVVKNGEAYDVTLETVDKPLARPPAKLEKLKTKKTKDTSLTKEDIESKMKAAEERRRTKEEEMKKRLRSDRPVTAARTIRGEDLDGQHDVSASDTHETLASGLSQNTMSERVPSNGPSETLDFDALEKVMSEITQSQMDDEDGDKIGAVESDITYNNLNQLDVDAGSDSF
uniref:Stathmin domain containing 1 n=1 Tax=Leptobrachium leishanense TaxID=445787 RepID=A0A8C5PKY6_9ANUR